jgi:uncharacterized membrane protein
MNKAEKIGIPAVLIASLVIALILQIGWQYPFLKGVRAVLGLIYVLFLPGYIVVRLFYEKLDWIEKLALSMGLSIALVILSVMFSNMVLKIPITPLTNFLVILVVIAITVLLRIYRAPLTRTFRNVRRDR